MDIAQAIRDEARHALGIEPDAVVFDNRDHRSVDTTFVLLDPLTPRG